MVDEVERNDESCIFCVDYSPDRVRQILLIPTIIQEFQARQATGERRAEILRRVRAQCAGLGTRTRETLEGLEIDCLNVQDGGDAP